MREQIKTTRKVEVLRPPFPPAIRRSRRSKTALMLEKSHGRGQAHFLAPGYLRLFLRAAYFASRAALSSASVLGAGAAARAAAAASASAALACAAAAASAFFAAAFFAAAFSALAASRSCAAALRSAATFSSTGGLARSWSSAFCLAAAAWPARSWNDEL